MQEKITPIKLGCSPKILPLVYDESLSYYESICKLNNKMNEIIENINNNLENYLEQHFNEIMVNAIYNEQTETITFKKELISVDGVHIYNASNKTMIIE